MQPVYHSVAGLDIHKKTVVACIRRTTNKGSIATKPVTYGTMTTNLRAMRDWLKDNQVTHVAMEATGVYWKPIWNILEDDFELLLVNPRELKRVPGRTKSDVLDCQWIAHLLSCGLLKSSFVAPRWQRELRDLTRQRAQLTGEQTRAVNRIHKLLEDTNIKLGAVASDIMGVSGRDMLRALIAGESDPAKIADLARRRLRAKIPQLQESLEGKFTDHHRFVLRQLLGHIEFIERQTADLDQQIATRLVEHLLPADQERLDEIVGVNRRTIEAVLAEIGIDMSRFPDEDHLCSWAAICPNPNISGGKCKRNKIAKGNHWLKRALAEAAWAASRSKNTYLAAFYRRVAARRGRKRALVAVAHKLLVIIYHLLKNKELRYRDLGGDYFDRLNPERTTHGLVRRLQSLGFDVQLTPKQSVA